LLRLLAAVLQSPPMVWLGAISYCLYLINEPMQKLSGVLLAVVAAGDGALFTAMWIPVAIVLPVLAAWWLHVWIEAPALRAGRVIAQRSIPAAARVSAG